jgi:hypothetical protein
LRIGFLIGVEMDEFWAFKADLYNPEFKAVETVVNAVNYVLQDKRFVGLLPLEDMPYLLFSDEESAKYALELLDKNGCPTDKHVVKIKAAGKCTR